MKQSPASSTRSHPKTCNQQLHQQQSFKMPLFPESLLIQTGSKLVYSGLLDNGRQTENVQSSCAGGNCSAQTCAHCKKLKKKMFCFLQKRSINYRPRHSLAVCTDLAQISLNWCIFVTSFKARLQPHTHTIVPVFMSLFHEFTGYTNSAADVHHLNLKRSTCLAFGVQL